MLSNYVSAALRNFGRNRTYSVIVTLSLAIGFAAMMLAAIYWRYEHSYDRSWPNGDRTYVVTSVTVSDGRPGWSNPPNSVGQLIMTMPVVEEATSLRIEPLRFTAGTADFGEEAAWADRNFFGFFSPTLIDGDLDAGLRPGAVVLTRSLAEKYYGRADVVGESLVIEGSSGRDEARSARIGAVIEDWPQNSHLNTKILLGASGDPSTESATIYLRVRPGVAEERLRQSLLTVSRVFTPRGAAVAATVLVPVPLRFAYMRPSEYGLTTHGGKGSSPQYPKIFVSLGALILAVSAVNFINLMTARGAGRAVEVGVRKVVGGRRRDLVIQFVGEGLLYTALAFVLALALVETTRPLIRQMTGHPLPFDYIEGLGQLTVFGLGAALVGVVASLYPAFILSGIRPARAIRNDFGAIAGSRKLRQVLVVLQFIPLLLLAGIGLVFFGMEQVFLQNSTKLIPENALVVREDCSLALKQQLKSIPGVGSVACLEMNQWNGGFDGLFRPIGESTALTILDSKLRPIGAAAADAPDGLWDDGRIRTADHEALRFFDRRLLAGRLWSGAADERGLVLTERAARRLGFDPAAAIGKQVALGHRNKTRPIIMHTVIGVINDRGGIANEAVGYLSSEPASERNGLVAGVRFRKDADLAVTTAAIDKAFTASAGRGPRRAFLLDELLERRAPMQRMVRWLAASVGVGLLVAAGGIFAMAVFLANLRTREIGVRKAFGASRSSLLRILVFQFAVPVLIANLVAIPLVILASKMAVGVPADQRLSVTLWSVAIVIAGSLAITMLATFSQAWRVTGQLPLKALRSE